MAESLKRTQPIPRIGDPDEIGMAALLLASDSASYVTGETMVLDGGSLCARGGTV